LATYRSGPSLVGGALRVSLVLTLLAGVVLMVAGPLVLRLLGPQYAPEWVLLPVLVPALVVSCVTQVYYGVCRARGHLAEATAVALFSAVLVVLPAAAVAHNYALTGVSLLWLASQLAGALVAGFRLRTLTAEYHTKPQVQVPAQPQGRPDGIEAS
jgi:O-antigen/teichoic acid export membrane protein